MNSIGVPLIGDVIVETCPPFLYTLIINELSISQHAGAAPFPWHNPCSGFELGRSPMKVVESPRPVRWKNRISWMQDNIAFIGPSFPPIASSSRDIMIWLILS